MGRWRPWTDHESAYLRRAAADGHDAGLISVALSRPRQGTARRMTALGISRGQPWATGYEVRVAISPKLFAVLQERAKENRTEARRLAHVILTATLRDPELMAHALVPNMSADDDGDAST